jgi:glycosyltransferase involved in cell wall biosynthesis
VSDPLISVVIPAFNAERTIDETLRSVRGQSWQTLEIIVVDDGSTDRTSEVVERHCAADPRMRLMQQANAGVAAARNAGWQSARSDLIAFIDADDLWAREKIARQMAVLERGGNRMGLVYSRCAQIDGASRITYLDPGPVHDGDVFTRLMWGNFICNGSAALVRRAAIEQARGFEPALHRAGAQGCEDILFYLRVAEHWHFGMVPERDVGYRILPKAMSADLARMYRSWLMVRGEMLAAHPEHRGELDGGAWSFGSWLLEQALRRRQFGQLPLLLNGIAGWRATAAPRMLLGAARACLRRSPPIPPSSAGVFEIGEPE